MPIAHRAEMPLEIASQPQFPRAIGEILDLDDPNFSTFVSRHEDGLPRFQAQEAPSKGRSSEVVSNLIEFGTFARGLIRSRPKIVRRRQVLHIKEPAIGIGNKI